MTDKEYDVIVIGAGSGGLNIAGFMNKAGFKVLLIDKTDKSIGGDCLNFGCVPSKALIHIAKLAHSAREAKAFGMKVSGNIDLKKAMHYVDDKKEIIREHENADYFRKKGMDVELGSAKFVGPHEISVNNNTFRGKKIVIATGSRPKQLEIPGADKIDYITNETVFNLEKLPKKLVVIGGGPIGIEMAQSFRRLGSEVTVVQNRTQFLPKELPEIADVLLKQLQQEGIKFHFNHSPKRFEGQSTLVITNEQGEEKKILFDNVLVSIGRQLNTSGLDLEKASVKLTEDKRKIQVNEYLQTTNKDVLLCGDITGSYQFTHAAELHAGVILRNFFSPLKKKVSYDHLSWVTYTTPEIATFGLSERELQKREITYEKVEHDFKDDDRSIVDDYREGKTILFISQGKILGGSMVAVNAGEIFQELVLANSAGLDIKAIFNKIYPYPTAARANKSTITKLMAGKLNERSKKILKFMYRFS